MLVRKDTRGRIRDSVRRRRRRVSFRDRRFRRPRAARHDVSRALRRDLAARPSDLRARRGGRRDPSSDPDARSRRARVAGRAGRARVAALLAGVHARGRLAQVRRLPRLHCQLREISRHRFPRRMARRARRIVAARQAQPRSSGKSTSRTSRTSRTTGPRTCATTATRTRTISSSPRSTRCSARRRYRSCCRCTRSRCRISGSQGKGSTTDRSPRQRSTATRLATYFDPLPFWYAPLEGARPATASDAQAQAGSRTVADDFPLHAITQRPMMMYHSWDAQNAWLRQIISENRLYMNRAKARELGLADDDWVWLESHHGRIRCQLRTMEGCETNTVWTWNAIGKQAGTWGLDPRCERVDRGIPAQSPHRRASSRHRR